MAVQAWTDVLIGVDQFEMAAFGKSFDHDVQVAELDSTPLSTTGWTTSFGGLKTATFSMSLMSDFADDGLDEVAFGLLGSTNTVRSIVVGSADGSKAYLGRGVVSQYTPLTGNVGELAMASMSKRSSGVIARGKLLHPNTARTSSSTGTGRQLGAVAAGKSMYAALHVFAVSGTSPTLDVIVQSDDNAGFTTPTSRITFSQANATTNRAQFSSVAGAITDDYWRISYTIGGSSTPTFAFIVTAGIL